MPRAGENAYAITMVLADLRDPNTLLQVTGWAASPSSVTRPVPVQPVWSPRSLSTSR